jgi:Glycosyl transferase family 2
MARAPVARVSSVKLVMTLRTRDHADLVDAHLTYHLSAGVDFVLVFDHRSEDGTREILDRFAREGYARVVRKDDERYQVGVWIQELAELAHDHKPDWVLASDADEFWWPSGGNLKDVLGAIPSRYGVLHCPWRHFAPRPDDSSFFAERMTVRLAAGNPWTRPEDPFKGQVSVAYRDDRSVRVRGGNHDVESVFAVLRGWYPIELLHFPLRTAAQAERKYRQWDEVLEVPGSVGMPVVAGIGAVRRGRFEEHYGQYVVDDARLAEGSAAGTMTVDTRVRDTLRLLAGDHEVALPAAPSFPPPGSAPSLEFPSPTLEHEVALAADVSELRDSAERVLQRVAELERRLAEAERRTPRRLAARLAAGRETRAHR